MIKRQVPDVWVHVFVVCVLQLQDCEEWVVSPYPCARRGSTPVGASSTCVYNACPTPSEVLVAQLCEVI